MGVAGKEFEMYHQKVAIFLPGDWVKVRNVLQSPDDDGDRFDLYASAFLTRDSSYFLSSVACSMDGPLPCIPLGPMIPFGPASMGWEFRGGFCTFGGMNRWISRLHIEKIRCKKGCFDGCG